MSGEKSIDSTVPPSKVKQIANHKDRDIGTRERGTMSYIAPSSTKVQITRKTLTELNLRK
jgi:hypothetical protein